GGQEGDVRAGPVAAGHAQQTEVVPGGIEMTVGVDGALELALGVLRKSLLHQQLAELIVQLRRIGQRAQRVDGTAEPGVERHVGGIEVLLDEERLLVRVLAAAVVIEGRATGQCQRGGGDGEQTFHVHSWIGFAFSLTLPSTTSTRKPTALTWYRSRTRSLCLLIMAVSC